MNLTCNSTLDDLRILPTSEVIISGNFTFHQLALIIAGSCTGFAIVMSFFLIWMHALHYTKPNEQKHIMRILFMVPVYAVASLLALKYYWHAIYFQVISDCYEAFAISSFFALLCSYIAPDLHEQKNYFRALRDIRPWVLPVNWFAKCCGGERGPWRTPRSGLTWFNIIWIGIYHYCFIRVIMTVTAVVTQYFGRYCESSNNPVFAHIWIMVIEALAVTIAMYCVIQFYVQLRVPLAEHQPFLKVLAIKLVIFLSFWQTFAISIATSARFHLIEANSKLAYPDIKVGIPSLLLCIEMALFSILHIWAFPYAPYRDNAPPTFYPVADPDGPDGMAKPNPQIPRSGGFLGIRALWDAANTWDIVKAFGRGLRWLFVGVHHRSEDVSYRRPRYKNSDGVDMDDLAAQQSYRLGVADSNDIQQQQQQQQQQQPYQPYQQNQFQKTGVVDTTMDTSYHPALRGQHHNNHSHFGHVSTNSSGNNNNNNSNNMPVDSSGRPLNDEAAGLIAYAQPVQGAPQGVNPPYPYQYQSEAYAGAQQPGRYAPQSQPQVLPPRPGEQTRPSTTDEEQEAYQHGRYGQGGRGAYGAAF